MKIRKAIVSFVLLGAVIMGSLGAACAEPSAVTGDAAREKVWNMMWRMATIRWTPSRNVYYMHQSEQIDGKTYTVGKVYAGMPYTQSSKSVELFGRSFRDMDNDGVLDQFQPWVPVPYTQMGDDNIDTIDILMGNDCSGAIYWALSTVADVTFSGTRGMMPANGTGLTFLDDSGEGILNTGTKDYSRAIFGSQSDEVRSVVYAWYDSLQKGDVLAGTHEKGYRDAQYVYGHTMMVESVDPDTQTVTVLQHGGPTAEWKKKAAFTKDYTAYNSQLKGESSDEALWNYGVISYADLFELYYLPLTLPEYRQPIVDPGEVSVDITDTGKLYLASGTVTSTHLRLQSVTAEIRTASGSLQGSVTLDTAVYRWKIYRTATTQRLTENSFDLAGLGPYLLQMGMEDGHTYRYTLTARLADGNDYLLRDFLFVY